MKIAPYVVPTTRSRPAIDPLTVPTRWVKSVFAIFLLPVCAILSQTFFTVFARATVTQQLWAGEEFWFFSLGAVLWLIAFFGLPRPIVIYVFGHELTHALWVLLMGGRISRFRVSREGGHVVTNRTNFWIALAPYFFPLYSILAIGVYGLLSLFYSVQSYGPLLYAIVGATWAFHFSFTCWMIGKNQTDLTDHGTFFSLVLIYLLNLLLLQRDAGSGLKTNHLRELRSGFRCEYRKFFALDCRSFRALQPRRQSLAVRQRCEGQDR